MGAAVLTIAGITTVAAGTTLAQTTNGQDTMIQKLATKLGISEDKVKSAFDQIHSEHETEMKQKMEQHLSDLVSQGKITEAQKQAIIAKMAELRSAREAEKDSFKNLTPEQRKAKMDAQKTDLENWAKSQGIDLSILPSIGHGGHGEFGGMRKHGMMMQEGGENNPQASASPSAQ